MTDDLLSQLKSNTRLRFGVFAIIALLWLYGVLVMHDALSQQKKSYSDQSERTDRIKQVAREHEWLERAKVSKATLNHDEQLLWKNTSFGLAQATIQDALKKSLLDAGVTNPSVQMSDLQESSSLPADIWQVRGKISFPFKPQSLNAWIQNIQKQTPRIVIDSLHIYRSPVPRVEAVVYGYSMKSKTDSITPMTPPMSPIPPFLSHAGS